MALLKLSAKCCHVHAAEESVLRSSQKRDSMHHEGRDIPVALAINLASALAAECDSLQDIIRVPNFISPEEYGDRSSIARGNFNNSREVTLVGQCIRMGLTPPAPLAKKLLVRRHVSDVKREHDFVYVGSGDLSLRVSPFEWSSPFRVGPDGDALNAYGNAPFWSPRYRSILSIVGVPL